MAARKECGRRWSSSGEMRGCDTMFAVCGFVQHRVVRLLKARRKRLIDVC